MFRDCAYNDTRTNVYGAKVPIPGDIDLLVAGFSCVDYSALNNKGKTLNQKGESRDTLEAILSYAEKWTPKMIVLENVYGAPWEKCVERAKKVGYAAEFVRVDTKDYYLPHTRTRGYMVCIHEKQFPDNARTAARQWKDLMFESKRRASAPASAFLLPADDLRVHQFNSQLTSQYRQDGKERIFDWDACRHRHQKARQQDKLGFQRPITNWVDNGTCVAFEHAHKLWLAKQVERVWDCIEIRFLRSAKDSATSRGYDPMFKTSIMELSQNVDRFAQEMPFGICSCITPSGIFYITDRGGPLTPYETLALQGLPLDKISFTVETMRELQDLAGNAMSSTVVGVAQLAALIVASPTLKQTRQNPPRLGLSTTFSRMDPTLRGEKLLRRIVYHAVNTADDLSLQRLCDDASQSVRLCCCEGQFGVMDKDILICEQCEHTVCAVCRSKPSHVYSTSSFNRTLTAHEFELRWKHLFPASLEFSNLPDMSTLARGHQVEENLGKRYFDIIQISLSQSFKFQCFKRTSQWTIIYESSLAILKLEIVQQQAEWHLFVKAPPELPGNDTLRRVIGLPVARAKLPVNFDLKKSQNNWAEQWEWFVPSSPSFPVSIQAGNPETNRSWRALYGLVDYQHETLPRQLRVSVSPDNLVLPEDISGVYEHLPNCGTACSSLYRRVALLHEQSEARPVATELTPLYLFLDPTRIGPVNEDHFVFSHYHERLGYDEERHIVAELESAFRPWDRASFSTQGSLAGFWAQDDTSTKLRATKNPFMVNGPSSSSGWSSDAVRYCSESLAVLSIKFHVDEDLGRLTGHRVDEGSDSAFLKRFAWVLGTNAHLPELKEWRRLSIEEMACDSCAPVLPSIKWAQTGSSGNKNRTFIVQEDPTEAAEYERRMKSRPRILDMTAVTDEFNNCHLRVGLNVVSLAHKARSQLPLSQHPPTLSWNVTTEYVPPSMLSLPPFRLLSNLEDEEYIQPRGFMLNLRPAQRRSLSWMRGQERGTKFKLEEVAEEIIEPIRWKIEAKAEVDLEVKGGVVADQVSYGKTVTSLALIHEGFCENASAPTDGTGLIPLKATLILVPNSLPNQWKQEALKCLPKAEYSPQDILVIKTKKDFEATRIDDLKRAKIVIALFNLCGQDFYINRLARLTALPETPSTNERHHKAWFKYALRRIPDMNTKLQELGVSSFEDYLNEELERTREHPDFTGIIPSRRTKGANYKSLDEQPVISKEKTKPLSRKVTAVPRSTSARKGDWGQMKMPVLHQFKWNRVVIDEFHYPRGKDYTALVALSAEKRWILSGTPPLDDFADVKRFAAFLGVDLGIDWDAPGVVTSENSKQMRKEKTSFELFQTFSEKRSPTWHERRHAHAQTFLDTFARQNFAEIGDVKCFEALKSVELPLDHRAVYEELSAHMQGCQMNIGKKPSNTETGDRVTHIRQSMRASRTAEEALINFSSVRIVADFSESACSALVRKRKVELCRQEQKIRGHIFQAARLAKSLGDPGLEWSNWISGYTGDKSIEIEDLVAHEGLKSMIESAEEECGKVNHKRSATAATELQKLVRNTLGAEARNFVAMRRSLRYARSVLKIYQQFQQSDATRDWDCGNKSHLAPASDVTLLVGCGHVLCQDCLGTAISEERCCISGCNMGIREHSVLSSDKLRRCQDVSGSSKNFGRKLDAVIELLEGIPDEEQAIIFVQSYGMMSMVNEALTSQGISAYAIDNVSESASDDIETFINNPKYTDKRKGKVNNKFRKVLILNLGDESAAGMNLVNANHVVFISPLLTNTSQKYHAAMVQSIGRARRYGQQRSVNVYRFISPSTVDVDILEQRELRSQALGANQQIMAPPYEPGRKGYEKTQLVKNGEGEMMLVPKSWIEDDHKAHQHGINLGVDDAEELERFTSLTMFSEAYGESGDG